MRHVPHPPSRAPARALLAAGVALLVTAFVVPEAASRSALPEPASFAAADRGGTMAFVVGDFGTGSAAEYEVAAAMEVAAGVLRPSAVLTTGDNLYGGDVSRLWDEPFAWVATAAIPTWISWGNHDVESPGRLRLVQETFDPPGFWYRRSLGGATVLFLDGNRPLLAEQRRWLEGELVAAAGDPVIVVMHQPPYSCSRHGGDAAVRAAWSDLFARRGVDLVLAGHDHNYQRLVVDGVTYVVTGGGGRHLYDVAESRCPAEVREIMASDDEHHHFVVLGVNGRRVEVRAYTASGDLIDVHGMDV